MTKDLLDPEKMALADGSTVADRLRAFADALVAHGQRGIFLMIDLHTQQFHISGHLPDDKADLRPILESLLQKLNADLAHPDGIQSVAFPQVH